MIAGEVTFGPAGPGGRGRHWAHDPPTAALQPLAAPTAGATRPSTTFTYGSGTTDVAVLGATNGSGGNVTEIAREDRTYDAGDRHMGTANSTDTVTYRRDALGRIIERLSGSTVTARYAYGDGSDAPVAILDGSSALAQRVVGLPGGAVVVFDGGTERWSYSNIHGDISASADASGTKVGPTRTYDPYGRPESGIPDNAAGSMDWGWHGQARRGLEHETGFVATVEMGARQYDPVLGRFLEVDPVEGGSCNDYDYACADPTNGSDLAGTKTSFIGQKKLGILFSGTVRMYGFNCGGGALGSS